MRHILARVPASLPVMLVLLASCGSTLRSPSELATERVETLAEIHSQEETFTLRMNVAACDCPEFEVLLDGHWFRVFLEPRDPEGPVEALRAVLSGTPDQPVPPSATVVGRLSKSARLSGNRSPCLVLKVIQVNGPGEPRPSE